VPDAEQVSNNVGGGATNSPIEELDEPTDTQVDTTMEEITEPTIDVGGAYEIPEEGTVDKANKEDIENTSTNGVAEREHDECNNHECEEPVYKPPNNDENASEFMKGMGAHTTVEIAVNTPAAGDAYVKLEEGGVDQATVVESDQLAVKVFTVVQRVNHAAMIIEERPTQDQHKTWHEKISMNLAQDAHQKDPGLPGGDEINKHNNRIIYKMSRKLQKFVFQNNNS
jgi:hypothetical protein